MLAGRNVAVDEGQLDFLVEVLAVVEEGLVADDVDLLDAGGADHLDDQFEAARDLGDVALQVLPAVRAHPVVEDDVVRRGVGVPLPHRVEQAFGGEVLGDRGGVGDVGRDVVRGSLHAELVALGPGVPDEAGGPKTALLAARFLAGGCSGSPFVLRGRPIALVDLDQRFDLGVVVAPVGAHAGSRGMGDRDRVVLPQIREQPGGAFLALRLGLGDRQGRDAALRGQDVPVAARVADAALVGVDRHEAPRQPEDVGDLGMEPVDVLDVLAAAVVVLADAEEVEFGGVEGVTVGLHQGAVVQAVVRELGVAVGVAPVDAVGPALRLDRVGADTRDVLGLVGMHRVCRVGARLRVDESRRRRFTGQ